jgi:hypothetical protein
MDKNEIRERINFLKEALEKGQESFILSRELRLFRKELKKIQSECEHEFQDGICIYCDKHEDR